MLTHHFTMHDTPSGIHANTPVQNDLSKLSQEQKDNIIEDYLGVAYSDKDLAVMHNCTLAIIDHVLMNHRILGE